MLVGNPHRLNNIEPRPHDEHGRRCDGRMMRAGKTEDAVAAAGVVRDPGRRARCTIWVVQTKREGRRTATGIRRNGKAAQRDKQALRRDCVSDDDADQRPAHAP